MVSGPLGLYTEAMRILGIETSCDETAAAIVEGDKSIVAERILSQVADHEPFGGVVPEIAARRHLEHLDALIAETLSAADMDFADLDGVAATAGPGLIGGVMVGLMTGKAIAAVHHLPFLAINHLEGHALSARLVGDLAFPYLLLLVSGGHCQFLSVEGVGEYRLLGGTVDDAAGEAFDKVAKMLGLGFPGGPAVEEASRDGDSARFDLPRPMAGRSGCDLSFSGLKTAVYHAAAELERIGEADRRDLAASFQAALIDSLADRALRAIDMFREMHPAGKDLVLAGGVAANGPLRARFQTVAETSRMRLIVPPPELCTDNAAMIGWAGIERLRLGMTDGFDAPARPRWPLSEIRAANG